MRDRLIRFAQGAGARMPDAFGIAVILLAFLFAAALLAGNDLRTTTDALYRGLWMLLAFSAQVMLMLVLGTMISATPIFRRLVVTLAALPRSPIGYAALATALTAVLGYVFWGLAIALGPLIAVHFARSAEARGVRLDLPWLLATQYVAGSVWQYGLSSSAALLVATPGHFLEERTGVMPLEATIWSPAAIALVIVFPIALVLVSGLLVPREAQPLSRFPDAHALAQSTAASPPDAGERPADASSDAGPRGLAAWADRTRVLPVFVAALLLLWLWHHFVTLGQSLDLNSLVTLLLLGAILLYPSVAAFSKALGAASGSAWQVLVLYQLYAGVAGLLQFTTLGTQLGALVARVATPETFPLVTASAATLVAFFVPSSGGQWLVQGLVTTEAALALGVPPELGLLAIGVGDQMGNLLSPFWIVLAAGVARVGFRAVYGYCLVYSVLWFVLGVAAFTFLG
jgi:short-chain fatty acids transporter